MRVIARRLFWLAVRTGWAWPRLLWVRIAVREFRRKGLMK